MFRGVPGFPGGTEKSISVAVRFIQHLAPERKMDSVWDDYQFPANDNFAKIYEMIMEAVKKDEGGAMALLTRHHARGESCNVELWILPQGHNYLYKFKPGEDICEFLAPEYVERGDCRLYMEIHVVPTDLIPPDRLSDEVMEDVGNDQLDEVSEQHEMSEQDEEDDRGEEDGSKEEEGRNADVNEKNVEFSSGATPISLESSRAGKHPHGHSGTSTSATRTSESLPPKKK
jgi:hypothetical protein